MNNPAIEQLTTVEERAIHQATRWFMRSRGGLSRQEQAELLDWLRTAPEHAAALDIVSRAWEASDEAVRSGAGPELLRAQSLSLMGSVVRSRPRRRAPRLAGYWPAAAVAAVSLAAVVALSWSSLTSEMVYAAPRGEQLSAVLPDGTRVRLDSGTRLSLRFTPFRRRIELDGGEPGRWGARSAT